ncbi:hypothetical protein CR513_62974, partial [Mucuna pruriens]
MILTTSFEDFYQIFLGHTLKPNILNAMSEFHINRVIPTTCTSSFTALISKKDIPQNLEEYRPVSLIGCLYYIIAKILAKNLKMVRLLIKVTLNLWVRGICQMKPLLCNILVFGLCDNGLVRL